ncbi:unnamed protein product [Moneuplotes crassus]|uniref:Uncharacterized protein n=2 Tax=Euplotes crassus TaxID=5936 RepID=A0AAD1Y4Z0_EUPCR|nr:unnamed protein product [Moneuplotes crassus]
MQNTNYSSSTDPQIGASTQDHDIGPKYGSFQHNDSDEDNEVNFMDNDDEGLYSHEDDDFDNSFDDSDLQNKDPEDIQNQLKELNDSAVVSLKDEETESANDKLKRCEQILENLISEGRDVDRNQIIVVLHNLACCHQRSSMLDDCVSYLDGTIFNINISLKSQILNQLSEDYGPVIVKDELNEIMDDASQDMILNEEVSRKLTMSYKFQKLRYLSRLHLQLGAVLSQINKHEEALYHGKIAALYCQDLIKNTKLLCEDYLAQISQTASRNKLGAGNSRRSNVLPNKDKLKNKIDKLHKFESKEKSQKSPKKPLLKSKEEGQVLGLPPEEEKKSEKEDLEDEPSIFFFEDDENELENLAKKCLPILTEMMNQITNFEQYNNNKDFEKEHQYEHTLIVDEEQPKRSGIGLHKSIKGSKMKLSYDKPKSAKISKDYQLKSDLCSLKDTVTGLLGVKRFEDWILNLNIGNVMHLSPLTLQEMYLQLDNSHELTRDAILEKVVLLSIAYFCVGTELRFLSQNQKSEGSQNPTEKYTKKESEKWQAKAVESACTFLPSECPLVGHVISSYQKHHSIISDPIPEDEELDEDLAIIRPLNEVKEDSINYHQIIKNHIKKPKKPAYNWRQEINKLPREIPKENKPSAPEHPPKKHKVRETIPHKHMDNEKRVKKKKTPITGPNKPTIRTQELGRTDLKKFLKRISTPSGTKTKAAVVMSSHDFNKIITKPHVSSKTKMKSKKSPITIKSKRPATQGSSAGVLPRSSKGSMPKYSKCVISPSTKYKPMPPRPLSKGTKAKKEPSTRPVYISRPNSSKPLSKGSRYSSQNTLSSHTKYLRLSQLS